MDGNKKGYIGKQILAALLATIPSFTYGIEMGWFWTILPLLPNPSEYGDGLTFMEISWGATALLLAAICGIPFFGMASDRFGRKICIIFMSILSCISWIIKIAPFKNFLILTRVLAGLAGGGCLVVVPIYIKEISENSVRGALISLTTSMCSLGVIFVYAIVMLLSHKINNWIYLSIAALHILVFCFMPESPSYLLEHRREEKAATAIAWLRNLKTNDKIVLDEITKLKKERREFGSKITLFSIFRDRPAFSGLRMTILLVAMHALPQVSRLTFYNSGVFRTAEFDLNTCIVLTFFLGFAGSFFTTTTIDKFGRKITLASSSLILSLCMATLATCLLLDFNKNLLPIIAYWIGEFAYGAGLATIPTVLMAEIFSYEVRTILVGVSVLLSYLFLLTSSNFYPSLSNALDEYVIFYILSAVTLLIAVYTILWVPETKGKSLKQIKEFWQKNPAPSTA